MQIIPHDSSILNITFKHATCKITRIRTCATEIRHAEEKRCFLNCLYKCQLSLFRPIVAYYIILWIIHILNVMCIPNSVYDSLDVGSKVARYISTITNFVSEMTSGQVVILAMGQAVTLTVEQIVCGPGQVVTR